MKVSRNNDKPPKQLTVQDLKAGDYFQKAGACDRDEIFFMLANGDQLKVSGGPVSPVGTVYNLPPTHGVVKLDSDIKSAKLAGDLKPGETGLTSGGYRMMTDEGLYDLKTGVLTIAKEKLKHSGLWVEVEPYIEVLGEMR